MTLINDTNFGLEVAKGDISGHDPLNKFGENNDIDIGSSPEFIWDGPTGWTLPTTARVHDISSDQAADASGGTGARTIRVVGLDSNYDELTEDVTMNGTSNVATVGSFVVIFRMFVLTSGSNGTNSGNISAVAQTDGTTTAYIASAKGQTQMAIYMVPNGRTFYMTSFYSSIDKSSGGAASVDVRIMNQTGQGTGTETLRVRHSETMQSTNHPSTERTFNPPKKFEEKTLVYIDMSTDTNNVEASAGFNGFIIDN